FRRNPEHAPFGAPSPSFGGTEKKKDYGRTPAPSKQQGPSPLCCLTIEYEAQARTRPALILRSARNASTAIATGSNARVSKDGGGLMLRDASRQTGCVEWAERVGRDAPQHEAG